MCIHLGKVPSAPAHVHALEFKLPAIHALVFKLTYRGRTVFLSQSVQVDSMAYGMTQFDEFSAC